MRHLLLCTLIATGITSILSGPANAEEQSKPAESVAPGKLLADALQSSRMSLRLEESELRGPGAARLIADAKSAQFVLLGEDHGFAEVPKFAQALYAALHTTGTRALVMEVGPLSASLAEKAVGSRDCDLECLNASYPFALPFLSWREEAALVESVLAQPGGTLIGVDQEFLLSPRMHFAELQKLAPDEKARKLAKSLAERDTQAYAAMIDQHDPGQVLLPKLDAKDFNALRSAFESATPQAKRIVDALEASAAIYRSQGTAPYDSNRDRSLLMKRNFMERYRELSAKQPTPRVLFKLGANHMGRGISPIQQFDLGNLASELAESTGSHSYHVLVIAAAGSVNRWLPFIPDPSPKQSPYDAHGEVDSLGAGPFIDNAFKDSWTYFDLAPLRHQPDARKAGGAAFAELAFQYDAVVVINEGHAAHFYGD